MNNINDNNEYDNYDEYSIKSVSIRDDSVDDDASAFKRWR